MLRRHSHVSLTLARAHVFAICPFINYFASTFLSNIILFILLSISFLYLLVRPFGDLAGGPFGGPFFWAIFCH